MGKKFDQLTQSQIDFIEQQKIYFVGTAASEGLVNISPKGMDSLKIINPKQVAWLNLTGSTNETAVHIQQLPRMTLMFCAFEGAPQTLKLFGQAQVLHQADPLWSSHIKLFADSAGARQIFILNIEIVVSSCGMSVPYFSYQGERDELKKWAKKKGQAGIEQYWLDKNQQSLDGKPSHIKKLAGLTK